MARKGDGIYLRNNAWWLDAIINGQRYQIRLGKNIKRTAAADIAMMKRSPILKGKAGIARKRRDISFEDAKKAFLEWTKANKRPKPLRSYTQGMDQLEKNFKGKKLSEIHSFLIEKHKQRRAAEDAKIAANRELTCLKTLFNRCIDWKRYGGENPTRRVKKFEESEGSLFNRGRGISVAGISKRPPPDNNSFGDF
jgi:hypothetical protein